MKILIYIFCAFCIAIITPLFTSQVSVSSHYPSSAAMASLLQAGITVFIFWLFFFVIAKAMIRKWESRKSRSGTKKKDPESCNIGTDQPSGCSSEPEPSFSPPPEAAVTFSAEPDPPRSVKKSSRPRRKAVLLSAIIIFLALSLSISVYFNIRLSGEYQRGYSEGTNAGHEEGYQAGVQAGIEQGHKQSLMQHFRTGIDIGLSQGYIGCLSEIYAVKDSTGSSPECYDSGYDLGVSHAFSTSSSSLSSHYQSTYDYGYETGYHNTFYAPFLLSISAANYYAYCSGYMDGFISAASPLDPDLILGFVDGCAAGISERQSSLPN